MSEEKIMLNDIEPFDGLVKLDNQNAQGMLSIVGRANFPRFESPDPKYGKYSTLVDVPKGSPQAQRLFAVVDHVARKRWGVQADEKLHKMAFAIASGFGGMDGSKVSIYDGDLRNPQYSAGCWQVKVSANTDQKPSVSYRAENGVRTLASEPGHMPKNNDGVSVAVEAWCQGDKDRVNLKVVGVCREIEGAGRPAPTPEQVEAKAAAVLDSIPRIDSIPGVIPKGLPAGQQAPPVAAQAAPERPPVYEPEVVQPAAPERPQPSSSGPSLMDI